MGEGKSDQKVAPKMVRESDLIAIKEQLKKLKEESSKDKAELVQLKSELRVAKTNLADDDEVKDVREFLLKREKELNEHEATLSDKESGLSERETSLKEREREGLIQTFASKYNLKVEEIKDADDPEKEALRLSHERLKKEKEITPAAEVFEGAIPVGRAKVKVSEMNEQQLADFEKKLKAEAGIK